MILMKSQNILKKVFFSKFYEKKNFMKEFEIDQIKLCDYLKEKKFQKLIFKN